MMRKDGVLAESLAEVMRNAPREAAGVDEDEGGAVLADQLGDAVVDLAPHLVGGDRAKLVARDLDTDLHRSHVADVDDGIVVAQEGGDILDGTDGRGESDPLGLGEAAL